ncbi:NAD-dependent epimerase/dehydratase family protein [bacterium]|nr:NAD-dependent epimerase/dehydratase family protein [bacterium]
MTIAVTGATGFIGSHLVEALLQRGNRVVCLIRKTSNLRWLRNLNLEFVYGDLCNGENLEQFVSEADQIFHLAGLTKARGETEYFAVNTLSTQRLLKVIEKVNPNLQRFVFLSSAAAAGPSPNSIPVRESDPVAPITSYGRSKAEAEKIVLSFSSKLPVTIIRPPAVYGPRDQDVYVYFKWTQRGVQVLIGKNRQLSLVFVKNLVQGTLAAAEHSAAIGEIFFITDDGIFTWEYLNELIARALGVRPICLHFSESLLNVMAVFAEAYGKIIRKPILLNREKIRDISQRYWICDNSKARQVLGFIPPHPTAKAIQETADWYRKHGWL